MQFSTNIMTFEIYHVLPALHRILVTITKVFLKAIFLGENLGENFGHDTMTPLFLTTKPLIFGNTGKGIAEMVKYALKGALKHKKSTLLDNANLLFDYRSTSSLWRLSKSYWSICVCSSTKWHVILIWKFFLYI